MSRYRWSSKDWNIYNISFFVGRSISRERIYSLCQKRIQILENSFLGFFGEQGEAQNFSTQNFVHFCWLRGANGGRVY